LKAGPEDFTVVIGQDTDKIVDMNIVNELLFSAKVLHSLITELDAFQENWNVSLSVVHIGLLTSFSTR